MVKAANRLRVESGMVKPLAPLRDGRIGAMRQISESMCRPQRSAALLHRREAIASSSGPVLDCADGCGGKPMRTSALPNFGQKKPAQCSARVGIHRGGGGDRLHYTRLVATHQAAIRKCSAFDTLMLCRYNDSNRILPSCGECSAFLKLYRSSIETDTQPRQRRTSQRHRQRARMRAPAAYCAR